MPHAGKKRANPRHNAAKAAKPSKHSVRQSAFRLSQQGIRTNPAAARVDTGIPGLDDLLDGGLPENGTFMLSGKCGTGKTTFGLQYLYHGAKNRDSPGVFVSLEKEPEEVISPTLRFNWDLEGLMEGGKLSIVKPDMHKFETFKKTLEDEIYKIGAKRMVIDSFSLISAYFHEDVYDVRRSITELARMAKRTGCTIILIEDILEGSLYLSYNGYKEFVVDGVIVLDLIKKDPSTFVRTVFVRKMVDTNHSLKLVPIEISLEGLVAYPDAEVF